VGEEALVGAGKGAAAENGGADGADSAGVSDAHVAAAGDFVDGHFGDDGNAHACADHAEKAAELAALENNLRMEMGAIAGGDGGIAKTMAIAEKEERFGAQIFQREGAAGDEFVFFGKGGEEAFGEQGKGFEFVAADGEGENGDIDGAGAEALEKDRSDFFNDGEMNLGEFAREGSEEGREEVGRDGRNDTDADGPAEGIFLLDDVAAGGFEFTENGASAWKKGFADLGEADGAAEAVEEAGAEFVFKFQDLLGERRLGDVRLFGGAAEGAGFGDGAEVAELVEFHV